VLTTEKGPVTSTIGLRNRLLSRIAFNKFPPPGMFINGWPTQLWEALLANIDAKALLYILCKTGTYPTSQITLSKRSDNVTFSTWPLLLKIEHMVKLQVFGNNSKTVNNIKNLTWDKNDQHIKIYLPCNFEVNLITHLGVIALFSSNL
jgi:hypothetical protein